MSTKDLIKRIPGAVPLYFRIMKPRAYAEMQERQRATDAVRTIERLHRKAALPDLRCDGEGVWMVDRRGIEWLYDTERGACAMGLELGREHEPGVMRLLAGRLKADDVLIDVGANVGYFAVTLAKTIPGLRVHAFEPVNATFTLLSRNIVRNRLSDRVAAHRVALGERAGEACVTNDMETGNHIVSGESRAQHGIETVRQDTLDALLERIDCPRVDFIKCDIEGAEMQFLRGAERTLRRDRPQLVMEIERRWLTRMGSSPEEVFRFLKDLGYIATPVYDDGRGAAPVDDPARSCTDANNFHCIHHAGS